jgi:hypothetical protein
MRKFLWMALVPVLALGACASDKSDKPKEEKKADKPAAEKLSTDNLICPQVAIVQEAQDVQDYGGEKPDPSQLVGVAHMQAIEGDCGYLEKGIDISFALHMAAQRGNRLGGSQASFPYFIAIVDPSDAIVTQQMMTAHFEFTGMGRRAEADEPLHVFIPLSKEALQAGPNYRVLVGFRKTAH